MEPGIALAESGWLPDWVVRAAIRRLVNDRRRIAALDEASGAQEPFIASLPDSAVAPASGASRHQHYEVPPAFFQRTLGPRLKYSCCLYDNPSATLARAEEAMLTVTCQRAQLENGMSILELGCGWGSLTLWMAEKYPASTIIAVSNSANQRRFIEEQCRCSGLSNVTAVTSDMNDFDISERFDRVVSVEMFEHMRNYPELLKRISDWLQPEGKLFVHIFCHARNTYPFVAEGRGNWMARNFFTGGLMPAFTLLPRFNSHLALEDSWKVNGMHYYHTCRDWLANFDAHRAEVQRLFQNECPGNSAHPMLQRWRMFFMACAEMFRYRDGEEWHVGHYLFRRL